MLSYFACRVLVDALNRSKMRFEEAPKARQTPPGSSTCPCASLPIKRPARPAGDYGELEEPTPWEVQDAIARIKAREWQRGLDAARADLGAQRGHEVAELQQRVSALVGRVHELESAAVAAVATATPPASARKVRASARSSGLLASTRSLTSVAVSIDDVAAVVRDKSRRGQRGSPAFDKPLSSLAPPTPSGAANGGATPPGGAPRSLLADALDVRGSHCSDDLPLGSSACSVGGAALWAEDGANALAHLALAPAELAALLAGATPAAQLADGCAVLHGKLKGTDVRLWRLTVEQSVTIADLARVLAPLCIAHPNIATLLGVAVEQCEGQLPDVPCDTADRMDESVITCGEPGSCVWFVEERHGGGETLTARLERGFLSWQAVVGLATDVCRALAYAQARRRPADEGPSSAAGAADAEADGLPPPLLPAGSGSVAAAGFSGAAIAAMAVPCNIMADASCAKASLVPALISHLLSGLSLTAAGGAPLAPQLLPVSYIDPARMFGGGEPGAAAAYAYGVTLLQLLTERQPQGLLGAVREATAAGSLGNCLPRLPVNADTLALAQRIVSLALTCTGSAPLAASSSADGAAAPTAPNADDASPEDSDSPASIATSLSTPASLPSPSLLEYVALPALEALGTDLAALGAVAMSWEAVEALVLQPLQPASGSEPAAKRWVRADFRVRHRAFLEEVRRDDVCPYAQFCMHHFDQCMPCVPCAQLAITRFSTSFTNSLGSIKGYDSCLAFHPPPLSACNRLHCLLALPRSPSWPWTRPCTKWRCAAPAA